MNLILIICAALAWEHDDQEITAYYQIWDGETIIGRATNQLEYELTSMQMARWYNFTVTAVGTNRLESDHSNMLRVVYPTNVVSVRAMVEWEQPGDLPTDGLMLHLDARDLIPGQVGEWRDRSIYSRHLTQTVSSKQPFCDFAGSVVFDGVDDELVVDLPINGWKEMTIVLLTQTDAEQNGGESGAEKGAIFWGETAPWGTVYVGPFRDSVYWRFGTGQRDNRWIEERQAPQTSPTLTIAIKHFSVDSVWFDDQAPREKPGRLQEIDLCQPTMRLGGAYQNTFFDGKIQKVLLYKRALSDREVGQCKAELLK